MRGEPGGDVISGTPLGVQGRGVAEGGNPLSTLLSQNSGLAPQSWGSSFSKAVEGLGE